MTPCKAVADNSGLRNASVSLGRDVGDVEERMLRCEESAGRCTHGFVRGRVKLR
jgi:hypothetical protein